MENLETVIGCWKPHLSTIVLLYIIAQHIFALLFFLSMTTWTIFFNITLHCYVSQATVPYMIFIKLLFIKYALLVIRLKIIRALV